MKSFANNSNQYVYAHSGPDLGFDCVLGATKEAFDPQMLFDPFEEQFDLPSLAVQFADGQSRQLHVIGQEGIGSVVVVAIADTTQLLRLFLPGTFEFERHDLVADQTRTAVDRLGIQAFELEIGGASDDEEAAR